MEILYFKILERQVSSTRLDFNLIYDQEQMEATMTMPVMRNSGAVWFWSLELSFFVASLSWVNDNLIFFSFN